jgi:hypothetical protein
MPLTRQKDPSKNSQFSPVNCNMHSQPKACGNSRQHLPHNSMPGPNQKRVYMFAEGRIDQKELLGNKGANLCKKASGRVGGGRVRTVLGASSSNVVLK